MYASTVRPGPPTESSPSSSPSPSTLELGERGDAVMPAAALPRSGAPVRVTSAKGVPEADRSPRVPVPPSSAGAPPPRLKDGSSRDDGVPVDLVYSAGSEALLEGASREADRRRPPRVFGANDCSARSSAAGATAVPSPRPADDPRENERALTVEARERRGGSDTCLSWVALATRKSSLRRAALPLRLLPLWLLPPSSVIPAASPSTLWLAVDLLVPTRAEERERERVAGGDPALAAPAAAPGGGFRDLSGDVEPCDGDRSLFLLPCVPDPEPVDETGEAAAAVVEPGPRAPEAAAPSAGRTSSPVLVGGKERLLSRAVATPAFVLAASRPPDVPAMGAGPSSWKGLKESMSCPGGNGNIDGASISTSTQPPVSDSNSKRPLVADADNNGEERSRPVADEDGTTGEVEPPRCCSVPFGVVTVTVADARL